MNKKPIIIVSVIVVLAIIALLFVFEQERRMLAEVDTFEECAEQYTVIDTVPAECRTPDGRAFVQEVENGENGDDDQVRLEFPEPNTVITSPLEVGGEARGTWFFEADFPIHLLDGNGNEIAESFVMTTENWMTEDFVSFEGTIEFDTPDTATGTLVLEKDNPSGESEFDDEVRIPVRFQEEEVEGDESEEDEGIEVEVEE